MILLSAQVGCALSTTQIATGSVLGSGVGKPGAEVRWGVAGTVRGRRSAGHWHRRRRGGGRQEPGTCPTQLGIFALVLAAVVVGVLFIARDFIAHHTGWYILGAPRPK